MTNLQSYGVSELTTEILNFYQVLLPSFHSTLAVPFFDIVTQTFQQNSSDPVLIQTLMTSL